MNSFLFQQFFQKSRIFNLLQQFYALNQVLELEKFGYRVFINSYSEKQKVSDQKLQILIYPMEEHIEEEGKIIGSESDPSLSDSKAIKNSNNYSKLSSSSFQFHQVRIPEDSIIIKDQYQKALINSIICPICLLTLPLPYYECQQCNNSFCPVCIEDWWKKSPGSFEKQCIFKCQNATFKKVKRSNTYVALMDALQFKCGLCVNAFPLSVYQKHSTRQCPEGVVQCSHQNCQKDLKRKDLFEHEKNCQFKLSNCQYCNCLIILKDLAQHQQNLCPERKIPCKHKGCQVLIKISERQKHFEECDFKQQTCSWCKEKFIQSKYVEHENKCESKKFECEWCKQFFKTNEFQVHNCHLRLQVCKLCQKNIIASELKEHRNECMFDNMIKIKQQNMALLEQNTKLHYKLNELQQLIQDSITNSEGKALQVMRRFKLKQRKQLEKDIQRIQNSLSSISRLRDEEINSHTTKYKHFFGFNICPQCKYLEKKFMDMKQPLILKRRQVMQKIQEVDKFCQTAKG